MTPVALCLLAVAQASLPAQGTSAITQDQKPSVEVEGVLLVTADTAETKRARKLFDAMSNAEFARLFPSTRYEIVPWNDRYRLAIDRTTGLLGRIADRTLIAKAFAKTPDGAGTLDVSSMTPEVYGAAKALAVEWPRDGETRRTMEPSALGINVGREIVLRSGVSTQTFGYRVSDLRRDTMLAALRRTIPNAPPAGHPGLSATERAAVPPPRDEFDFLFTGVAGKDETEGLGRASEAIKGIAARMRRESDTAVQSLLKDLGYSLASDSLGPKGVAEMTKAMRNQIQDQLRNGWQRMGFASPGEALAFLDTASTFEVRTTLDLRQTIDPGDPSRMMGSAGVGWRFQELPGLYLP